MKIIQNEEKEKTDMKNMYWTKKQDGISFYIRNDSHRIINRYINSFVDDIYVEPGVKEVCFENEQMDLPSSERVHVSLYSVMKQFPDVERLKIGRNIMNMDINNFMFPNVKEVIVDPGNPTYISGEMLVSDDSSGRTLLNAFCRAERDTLDLDGISRIKANALAGTYARNFINCHKLYHVGTRLKGSVKGSAIQLNPSLFMIDDKIVIGHLLLMVNNDSKYIHLTEDIHFINDGVDFKNIETVSISSINRLEQLRHSRNLNRVLIEDTGRMDFYGLSIDRFVSPSMYLDVSDKNPYYFSYNGIIYSKDKKHLILCTNRQAECVDVCDGTQKIEKNAFSGCANLKTISIPDSVTEIDDEAFYGCTSLESVNLGTNVQHIGNNTFSGCYSVKDITFHDGLEEIGDCAFKKCNLHEVHIPKSVKRMGAQSLPDCIHDIYVAEDYPQDIILSFVSTYNNACTTCFLHIENYGDVCVPAELSLESVEFINLQFNLHNLDKDFTNTLYKYAMSVDGKQCAAILVYNKTKQEEVGKYLRRAGKSIVQKFIWNRDESALIEFIQTGLLTDKTLKSTLDSISDKNMPTVSAYILKKIGESEDTTSFRL